MASRIDWVCPFERGPELPTPAEVTTPQMAITMPARLKTDGRFPPKRPITTGTITPRAASGATMLIVPTASAR